MNWDSVNLWPYGCLGVGVYCLFASIWVAKKLSASRSWPSTTGNILVSTIETKWDSIGGSDYTLITKPKVVYEYEVAGKTYRGNRLALVESNSSNPDAASKKIVPYVVGRQVTVYYDPQKPESATLAIGDPTHGILPTIMFAIGVIATIGGAVWLVMGRK